MDQRVPLIIEIGKSDKPVHLAVLFSEQLGRLERIEARRKSFPEIVFGDFLR
jgi:hypothetical protein